MPSKITHSCTIIGVPYFYSQIIYCVHKLTVVILTQLQNFVVILLFAPSSSIYLLGWPFGFLNLLPYSILANNFAHFPSMSLYLNCYEPYCPLCYCYLIVLKWKFYFIVFQIIIRFERFIIQKNETEINIEKLIWKSTNLIMINIIS